MNSFEYVYKMFRLEFDKHDFNSEEEMTLYQKEADEWWMMNHLESDEEYRQRTEWINRPTIYGIIHVP